MMAALCFAEVAALAPSLGVVDVPCPLCSVLHNPRRKVLRIWREREDFIGYACARCGEKGWARSGDRYAACPPEQLAKIRREAADRRTAEVILSRRTARWLWSAAL